MVMMLSNRDFLDITESLIVNQWHCNDKAKAERLETLLEKVNNEFCLQVISLGEEPDDSLLDEKPDRVYRSKTESEAKENLE